VKLKGLLVKKEEGKKERKNQIFLRDKKRKNKNDSEKIG
jgi:hypothetical protein